MLASLAALALLAAPSKEAPQPSDPNPFVAQAKDLYAKLEFEKCLKRLAQASRSRSTPQDLLEVELYAGLCHFGLGQKGDAEERFKRAVRLDPAAELPPYTSPRALELFSRAKRALGPPPEAAPRPDEDIPGLVEAPPEARGEGRSSARPAPKAEPRPEAHEPKPELRETRAERQEPPPPPPDAPREQAEASDAGPAAPRLTPREEPDREAKERLTRPPEPTFLAQKAPAIALTGVAAAGLGVGIGFGAATGDLAARARGAEFESDFFELKRQAEVHAVVANVSYGVAATAAVVATVLWLTGN